MKINKYLVYSLLLAGGLFASCDDYENSPDDFPLNYEIPSLGPDPSIIVGAYLVDPELSNASNWTRLTEPFNDGPASQGGGKIGPYYRPMQGQYVFNTADEATSLVFGNMVRWAKQAGIDFFIAPTTESHRWNEYPNNLNSSDTLMLNLISGRNDTLGYANRGDIKYAICYNIDNFAGTGMGPKQLSNNILLEDTTAATANFDFLTPSGQVYGTENEAIAAGVPYVKLPREERLYSTFRRLSDYFSDETYQTTPDGRPILFLDGAQRLYTQKSREIYDNIRDTIFKYSGKEVYLVARQQQWTPSARFSYFFLDGGVDAITPNRMTETDNNSIGWQRAYMLGPSVNEHFKANKDYLSRMYPDIDYIPSVSPSFREYLRSGNYQGILIPKEETTFRMLCNVAKMNQGNLRMVILDSFNDWTRDTQIEPSDPDYGNGYGTFFLDIFRAEFKGRQQ